MKNYLLRQLARACKRFLPTSHLDGLMLASVEELVMKMMVVESWSSGLQGLRIRYDLHMHEVMMADEVNDKVQRCWWVWPRSLQFT